MKRAAAVLVAVGTVALAGGAARSDSYVTLRGQYYKEDSTRVVQPVVELSKDLPNGVQVRAYYLLDAITSASAASGPSGDTIFTEYRNETSLEVSKEWSRVKAGLAYRYSAESDYWSHTLRAFASLKTWSDTGTLSLSFGRGWDQVGRRVQGAAPSPVSNPCVPTGSETCPLDITFGGVGYSQVLFPTVLAQAGYEVMYLDGYLASPYRTVASMGLEKVPRKRLRNAVSGRVAKYLPATRTGLQLHYRYYWDLYPGTSPDQVPPGDPWHVRSHTFEGRVFQEVGSTVELRFTGRLYLQGAADFWCQPASCYTGHDLYTSDPKLAKVTTTFLEGKIYWEAVRWRELAFLRWFSAGTFELSYGHFAQSTSFGGAHVLQAGYTFPF